MVTTTTQAQQALVGDFLDFLNEAWTPFHATAEARRRLLQAGFEELDESKPLSGIKAGGKYFYTRNMSALVAFAVGGEYVSGNGWAITGAHTDSPCPKLKPISKSEKAGFLSVGVQPYGGGLWHTWFDRDLGLAGRVIVRTGDGSYAHRLVKVDRPVLRIPTLAIHLTKNTERSSFSPNLQGNFYPVLATEVRAMLSRDADRQTKPALGEAGEGAGAGAGTGNTSKGKAKRARASSGEAAGGGGGEAAEGAGEAAGGGAGGGEGLSNGTRRGLAAGIARHHPLLLSLLANELGCESVDIEDFELQLCDIQPSCLGGADEEFVFSGRLDNLCSSWQSVRALTDSCGPDGTLSSCTGIRSAFLFDHEEVGSSSCHGASGTLLPECLRRVTVALSDAGAAGNGLDQAATVETVLRNSFLVSADMAHAVHPNYTDRHDPELGPRLQGGMVIKHNANQRYATNAVTAFLFRELGRRAGLPTQEFAVKNDSPCGSTIGPMLSALSGVRTVDVGSGQLSMHSCREMMGTEGVVHGYRHLKAVFEHFFELDSQLKVDADNCGVSDGGDGTGGQATSRKRKAGRP